MLKCPNCKKDFEEVAESAFFNVDQYHKSATTLSKCCGVVIRITPVRRYKLDVTNLKEDDWGNKPSKLKVKA